MLTLNILEQPKSIISGGDLMIHLLKNLIFKIKTMKLMDLQLHIYYFMCYKSDEIKKIFYNLVIYLKFFNKMQRFMA